MKFTIHGFSQQKAIELGLSNDDLLTLRWIIDFSHSGKMKSVYRDGKLYYWVNYKALLDDIPILNIKKDTLYRRLKKMAQIGVLCHTTVIENGTYSYYSVGEKYIELLSDNFAAPAYNQEYSEVSDTNPIGSDTNPKGTDENPKGGTDENPKGTDLNPEQRPYILDTSIITNKSTRKINNSFSENRQKKEPTSGKASSTTKSVTKIIPHKHKHGEFKNVLLTAEDLQKLQDRFDDWEERIDRLSFYVESTGKKYKSHYATILSWARREEPKKENNSNSANPDYSWGVEGVDYL